MWQQCLAPIPPHGVYRLGSGPRLRRTRHVGIWNLSGPHDLLPPELIQIQTGSLAAVSRGFGPRWSCRGDRRWTGLCYRITPRDGSARRSTTPEHGAGAAADERIAWSRLGLREAGVPGAETGALDTAMKAVAAVLRHDRGNASASSRMRAPNRDSRVARTPNARVFGAYSRRRASRATILMSDVRP